MSPGTPFSDAFLPNHTKMFELVHMVTSMEDFVITHIVVAGNKLLCCHAAITVHLFGTLIDSMTPMINLSPVTMTPPMIIAGNSDTGNNLL